jgi:hypothetical protein
VTNLIWRILLAVVAVVIVYALIPPVSRVIGFPVSGDLLTIVKVCVAGLAVLYIGWGKAPFGQA